MINFGRKKVMIPISKDEFRENPIECLQKHLGTAIGIFNYNVQDIEELHNAYLGNQSILTNKQRYDGSSINNKVVENHIYKQVQFKVGFMYGNPIEYTIINQNKINSDDLTYLNTYFNDVNKASLDITKAQDLYEFGIAYQLLIPRRTVVESPESQAPFELYNLNVRNTFIIYSNDTIPEQLCGVIKGKKRIKETIEDVYSVYFENTRIDFSSGYKVVAEYKSQPYNYIPIQEYCLNNDRIGIIEPIYYLQEFINKLDSLELDEIEENVNSFIAFFNQRVDDDFADKVRELKKQRILVLNSNNPSFPADIKMLSSKIDHTSINTLKEMILKAMYDIISVPQASGNVTSGGDTGQARILGNGWESAQNVAQLDKTYLTLYERKMLNNVLWICKQTDRCPIKDLFASDIAVKYNINMSNNLLVKSESLKMLNDINFPEKQALNIVGITNDIDGVGDAWVKRKQEQTLLEQKQEAQETKVLTENSDNII